MNVIDKDPIASVRKLIERDQQEVNADWEKTKKAIGEMVEHRPKTRLDEELREHRISVLRAAHLVRMASVMENIIWMRSKIVDYAGNTQLSVVAHETNKP